MDLSNFNFTGEIGLTYGGDLGALDKGSTKFISDSNSTAMLGVYVGLLIYLIGGLNLLKLKFLYPCLEDLCSIFADKRLYGLKTVTYLFFMNADQFFYLVFCTIYQRQVFGIVTFYFCDVLLYSLLFGLTLLVIPKFAMNNCMFYRDALLVLAAVGLHLVFYLNENPTLLWACLGLYVLYVVLDWKNDAFTHLGMKLLGQIRDDDSFEGQIPMQMERKRLDINGTQYDEIGPIIEKHRERFDRNLKNHRIWLVTQLGEEREDEHSHNYGISVEEMMHKVEVRMRFAEAVYKHIFFLKDYIEQGQILRDQKYKQTLDLMERISEGNARPAFPESMGRGNIDLGDGDARIDELSEEQLEDADRQSEHDSPPARKSATLKEDSESVRDEKEEEGEGYVGDDSKSERSGTSSFSKRSGGNLHTTTKDKRGFDEANRLGRNHKQSILSWPEGFFARAAYVVFFPFYLLYWVVMPNIMVNPEIIKVGPA